MAGQVPCCCELDPPVPCPPSPPEPQLSPWSSPTWSIMLSWKVFNARTHHQDYWHPLYTLLWKPRLAPMCPFIPHCYIYSLDRSRVSIIPSKKIPAEIFLTEFMIRNTDFRRNSVKIPYRRNTELRIPRNSVKMRNSVKIRTAPT